MPSFFLSFAPTITSVFTNHPSTSFCILHSVSLYFSSLARLSSSTPLPALPLAFAPLHVAPRIAHPPFPLAVASRVRLFVCTRLRFAEPRECTNPKACCHSSISHISEVVLGTRYLQTNHSALNGVECEVTYETTEYTSCGLSQFAHSLSSSCPKTTVPKLLTCVPDPE
ncbi:hypothetical protein PENSPDRAFT_398603 [Peniophora sp. CONT]|nr:hypothetical protein PENSPDRAFT_398603 [Peniophora sp. CONT]